LWCYLPTSSRSAHIFPERDCVRSTSRSTRDMSAALRLGLRPQPRSLGCGFAALCLCVKTVFLPNGVACATTALSHQGALKRVLGEDDMAAFKRKWEKFVLGLRQSEDW
jgi:hypothetical protein